MAQAFGAATAMAAPSFHLRQLDERPPSREYPRGIHKGGVRRDAAGTLAHFPSPDKTASSSLGDRASAGVAEERVGGGIKRTSWRSREEFQLASVPAGADRGQVEKQADAYRIEISIAVL